MMTTAKVRLDKAENALSRARAKRQAIGYFLRSTDTNWYTDGWKRHLQREYVDVHEEVLNLEKTVMVLKAS